MRNNYNPTIQGSTVDSKAHFYLIAGFSTPIADEIILKPSVLSRYVEGATLAIDISANFDIKNQFRFGVSYRWDAAISAIAGINVTEAIQAGYSYDYLTNALSKYASGSHQFYLKFTFLKSDQLRRTCNCSFTD